MRADMKSRFRAGAKVCSGAIMVLLVIAALGHKMGPRTELGWQFDHFIGYFGITLFFCFAWPRPFMVGGNPPRLIARQQFRRSSPPRLILKIDIRKRLPVVVAHDKAGVLFLDGPRRREARAENIGWKILKVRRYYNGMKRNLINTHEDRWERGFAALSKFRRRKRHCYPSRATRRDEARRIAANVAKLRKAPRWGTAI
jgi:hypothetical protein